MDFIEKLAQTSISDLDDIALRLFAEIEKGAGINDLVTRAQLAFGFPFITARSLEKKLNYLEAKHKNRYSPKAQEEIGKKIKILKDEGKPQAQAAAVAINVAREKGLRVPEKKEAFMNAKEAMLKVLADTAKELGKGEPVKNPPSVGDKAIPEDLGYELAKHHAQLAEKTDKIAQQVIRYKESEAQKAGVPELEEQVRSESDQLTAFLAQLEKGVAVFMLEKDKWATNLRQVLNPGTDFTKVTATMRQELELLSKSNVVADQLLKKLDDMLRSDNQDFLKVSPPPKPVSKKNLKKYEKETPYRFPEEGGEGKKAASWLRVAESAPGMLEAFWDSIEDLANEFGELIEEIVDVSAVIDHKLAGQEA